MSASKKPFIETRPDGWNEYVVLMDGALAGYVTYALRGSFVPVEDKPGWMRPTGPWRACTVGGTVSRHWTREAAVSALTGAA